jgi:hypothetical protein
MAVIVLKLETVMAVIVLKLEIVVAVIVWQLNLQLSIQSLSITTKVVISNPFHGEVYLMQHYMIKFASDL